MKQLSIFAILKLLKNQENNQAANNITAAAFSNTTTNGSANSITEAASSNTTTNRAANSITGCC